MQILIKHCDNDLGANFLKWELLGIFFIQHIVFILNLVAKYN